MERAAKFHGERNLRGTRGVALLTTKGLSKSLETLDVINNPCYTTSSRYSSACGSTLRGSPQNRSRPKRPKPKNN